MGRPDDDSPGPSDPADAPRSRRPFYGCAVAVLFLIVLAVITAKVLPVWSGLVWTLVLVATLGLGVLIVVRRLGDVRVRRPEGAGSYAVDWHPAWRTQEAPASPPAPAGRASEWEREMPVAGSPPALDPLQTPLDALYLSWRTATGDEAHRAAGTLARAIRVGRSDQDLEGLDHVLREAASRGDGDLAIASAEALLRGGEEGLARVARAVSDRRAVRDAAGHTLSGVDPWKVAKAIDSQRLQPLTPDPAAVTDQAPGWLLEAVDDLTSLTGREHPTQPLSERRPPATRREYELNALSAFIVVLVLIALFTGSYVPLAMAVIMAAFVLARGRRRAAGPREQTVPAAGSLLQRWLPPGPDGRTIALALVAVVVGLFLVVLVGSGARAAVVWLSVMSAVAATVSLTRLHGILEGSSPSEVLPGEPGRVDAGSPPPSGRLVSSGSGAGFSASDQASQPKEPHDDRSFQPDGYADRSPPPDAPDDLSRLPDTYADGPPAIPSATGGAPEAPDVPEAPVAPQPPAGMDW